MARYRFTREDCVRGGKARAAMPDFALACSAGFWKTCETHPFFARKHLKAKIRAFNTAKSAARAEGGRS